MRTKTRITTLSRLDAAKRVFNLSEKQHFTTTSDKNLQVFRFVTISSLILFLCVLF